MTPRLEADGKEPEDQDTTDYPPDAYWD